MYLHEGQVDTLGRRGVCACALYTGHVRTENSNKILHETRKVPYNTIRKEMQAEVAMCGEPAALKRTQGGWRATVRDLPAGSSGRSNNVIGHHLSLTLSQSDRIMSRNYACSTI
jgi:hypothetical protein